MNKVMLSMFGLLAPIASSVSWASPDPEVTASASPSSKPRYSIDQSNLSSLSQLISKLREAAPPQKSNFETEEQYQSRVQLKAGGLDEYDFYVDIGKFGYIAEIKSFIVILPKRGELHAQIVMSSDGGVYEGQNAYGLKSTVIRRNSVTLWVQGSDHFNSNMIRLTTENGRSIYSPRSCYSFPVDFSDCREVVRFPVEPAAAESMASDLIARIHYKVRPSPQSLELKSSHVSATLNSLTEIASDHYTLKNYRIEKVSFFRASSGEILHVGAEEPVTVDVKAFWDLVRYEKPLNDGSPKLKGVNFSRIDFEIENTLSGNFYCTNPDFHSSICTVNRSIVKKSICITKGKNAVECPSDVINALSKFGMRLKYRARKSDGIMVIGYRGSISP